MKTIGETPMFFPAPEAGFFCGIFAEKIHRHNKVPSYRAVWDEMFFSVSKVFWSDLTHDEQNPFKSEAGNADSCGKVVSLIYPV